MLTQERLKELFNLDPETGILYWKKKSANRGNRIKVGDQAGWKNSKLGYCSVGVDGKHYLRSRLVFLFCTGVMPKEVDHRNRIPGDDRPSNLRQATRSMNCCNRESGSKNKKSGLPKGVWFKHDIPRSNPYIAEIKANGVRVRLGAFETPELASQAYQKAALELHGEFACFGDQS